MKTVLRILFIGAAIGAFVTARLAQAERKRLKTELALAWKTANERAILPDDLDARIERSKKMLNRARWEDEALGRLPGSWNEEDDDEA
jgi:hypothetical protein